MLIAMVVKNDKRNSESVSMRVKMQSGDRWETDYIQEKGRYLVITVMVCEQL